MLAKLSMAKKIGDSMKTKKKYKGTSRVVRPPDIAVTPSKSRVPSSSSVKKAAPVGRSSPLSP